MNDSRPSVSVIIPARGSASTLPDALRSIRAQSYPNIEEVIVAAADDDSARVAHELGAHVVPNPSGSTPAGLNLAIDVSRGEVIVRCDAQSKLPVGYVERAVATLWRTGSDNVGGMQVPTGRTPWERAIAASMSSPLGAGDAHYRLGGHEGSVETVYLGVFRRATLRRVGGFDEAFSRTQDYELNHRIIAGGGEVWFDPGLKVEYRPRGSLGALARQYFDYGRAKRMFARKHPGSLRWRQLAAPGVVLALGLSITAAVIEPLTLMIPVAYVASLLIGAVAMLPRAGLAAVGTPLALATMHVSWGIGFLLG